MLEAQLISYLKSRAFILFITEFSLIIAVNTKILAVNFAGLVWSHYLWE